MVGESDADTRPARRMSEYSPTVELLSSAVDILRELVHITVAAHGGKPGQIPYTPRPVTAAERVRRRRRVQRHENLVARVLPGRSQ